MQGCDHREVFSQHNHSIMKNENITGHFTVSVRVCLAMVAKENKHTSWSLSWRGDLPVHWTAGQFDGFIPATMTYKIGGREQSQELPHPQCISVSVWIPPMNSTTDKRSEPIIHNTTSYLSKVRTNTCHLLDKCFLWTFRVCVIVVCLIIRAIGRRPQCYPNSSSIHRICSLVMTVHSKHWYNIITPFNYCTHSYV